MTQLRYICKKLSVTGNDLARMTGLSKSMIYKYLSGDRPVSAKTAKRFAAVLNVSPEELMDGAERTH